MKNFFIILVLSLVAFYACEEDSSDPISETNNESISMGAGYIQDIYYNLENGVVSEVPRTNWDIAFSADPMSSSIIINDGAGVVLKEVPTIVDWQWSDATDTTGYSTWESFYNSNETWELGAFGQNAGTHPNYGWGEYNETTHNVEGVALYIIKLVNGDFKRIFIEIKDAMQQEYTFKYSNIDGSDEVAETISFAGLTENFIYYSIENKTVLTNREPDASTWDLLFTQYRNEEINYLVTGVKQNIGVEVIEMDNVEDMTSVDYIASEFDDNITEIGSDWKEFNNATFQYSLDNDKMYFVKNTNGDVYKLVFTGFEGSSSGNIEFDITKL